jgi:hypothetical protein
MLKLLRKIIRGMPARQAVAVAVFTVFAVVWTAQSSFAARLWSTGFELNSLTDGMEFDVPASTGLAVSTTTVRSGTYALRHNSTTAGYIQHQWLAANADDSVFIRFYVRITTLHATGTIRLLDVLDSTNNTRASIRMTSTGTLQLFNATTQVGSDSSALSTGTWYRVEMEYTSTAGAGADTLTARIDGTNFATSSAQTLNTVQRFQLGAVTAGTGSPDIFFDDISINDTSGAAQTSWPGNGSIVHLRPNADGERAEGSRGGTDSGSDFGQVDEVTPNDVTDYWIHANNGGGDETFFNIDDTAFGTSPITLVQVGARVSGAATAAHTYNVHIESVAGGTLASGTITTLAVTSWDTNDDTVPRNYMLTSYTDPEAGGAWTTTLLDGAQIGADAPDANPDVYISTMWALTEYDPTITVATSTSQPATVNLSDTDAVIGSASIVASTGSHSVTAVRLEETGTINAANDLSNIELWLSSDDTWDAGDNQLSTAQTFDGSNFATFTETFTVTTTPQYLIARLDVDPTASDGNTIEIQFDTVTTVTTTSGVPLDLTGTTTVNNPTVTVASVGQSPHEQILTAENVIAIASIVSGSGDAPITSTVVTEGGTIDADTELSGVELWFSADKILDGSDTQVGSAGTFNGVNGTVTFNGTYTVTSTTKYLLLVADIETTADVGDTVEIEFTSFTSAYTVNGDPLTISDTTNIIAAGFYDPNWNNRRRLTFDNAAQATAQTDVPVLVKLNSSRITYANVLNTADDIRFVDSNNGTELAYQIEEYSETGDDWLWVKVPQVNGASALDYIWMYYSNSSATAETDTDVFSNGYVAVYHFAETAGNYVDWTTNTNDSTAANVITRTNTKFGNAPSFDGTTADGIRIGDNAGFDTGVWTVEAWINPSDLTPTPPTVSSTGSAPGVSDAIPVFVKGTGEGETQNQDVHFYLGYTSGTDNAIVDFENCRSAVAPCASGNSENNALTGTTTFATSNWYYLTATEDYSVAGDDFFIYVNGIEEDRLDRDQTPNIGGTQDIGIATAWLSTGTAAGGFSGQIEEVRFSNVARSADWIKFQYEVMNDAAISFGAEQTAVSARRVLYVE